MPNTLRHALVAPALCGLLALGACGGSKPPAADTSAPAPAAATPAAPAATFDLASLPVVSTALPAFPYLDWPQGVPENQRRPAHESALDPLTVIAGESLLAVEGQLEKRVFSLPAGLSPLQFRRDTEQQITALGGVKVNGLQPVAANATITSRVRELAGPDADVAAQLGLDRYDEGQYEYAAYALRTPDATLWFVVQASQFSGVITVLRAPPLPAG